MCEVPGSSTTSNICPSSLTLLMLVHAHCVTGYQTLVMRALMCFAVSLGYKLNNMTGCSSSCLVMHSKGPQACTRSPRMFTIHTTSIYYAYYIVVHTHTAYTRGSTFHTHTCTHTCTVRALIMRRSKNNYF